jgi:serine protease AprX
VTIRPIALVAVAAVLTAPIAGAFGSHHASPAPRAQAGGWAGGAWGDADADQYAKDMTGKNDPAKDPGSLFNVTTAIGARALWNSKDANGRAITGQGVTVALIDSGVTPVAGLDAPGKVIQGPDLSLETNSAQLRNVDDFGHGTFLAGIIAAHDATQLAPTGAPTGTKTYNELGVAPDARILALKLATRDGSTDVSQVIAALDWVVQHKSDNGMNVRVVNLSFGTESVQSYQLDPLAAAAENAWRHGLVVVVSAGNDGVGRQLLTDPASDPYVIAVGAMQPGTKGNGYSSPDVADFTNAGNAARHPDLIAPGSSIVSLRDPGSFVDANFPSGLVSGDTTGRLFRGSGTSQAAAVVSGAAALLLQDDPALTPDQVKAVLVGTATPLKNPLNALAAGAGEINLTNAEKAVQALRQGKVPAATLAAMRQRFAPATGTGSLEAARGGSDLVDPVTGTVLSGEIDVQGQPWNGPAWAAASAAGTSWVGSTWNGSQWTGDGWLSGSAYASAAWTGARWSGARWSDLQWDGARWSGARWSGARWSGARWSGAAW